MPARNIKKRRLPEDKAAKAEIDAPALRTA